MAEQKPIISIDHVSMRFNLAKEKHESLKEYFVALLHGGIRFSHFCWNRKSPTESTSSAMRISGLVMVAMAKPMRATMPEE